MRIFLRRKSPYGQKDQPVYHIHQSIEDLIKKVQMLRLISHETGSCYQRCVGFDALNATYITTYEIDEKHKTEYHSRFIEYLKMIQETNKMVVGGMTDPKGDRSKAPHQQTDPDVFVHIVEKNEKGIVIRGAKAHMTEAQTAMKCFSCPRKPCGRRMKSLPFVVRFL